MTNGEFDMNSIGRIAREAGRAILAIYKKDFTVEYKDDRSPLTLNRLDVAYGCPVRISIPDSTWQRVVESRRTIEQRLAEGDVIYGVNTGFGKLCDQRISQVQLEQLQQNLANASLPGGVDPAV